MQQHSITMLGTGLIGDFYTTTLHGQRSRDRVQVVYSRSAERGTAFQARHGIAESTTDMAAAIEHPDTDVVVVGAPELPPRGGDRARREGRQGRALHEAARAHRRRGPRGCSRPSRRRASSPATSRTSATRRRLLKAVGVGQGRRDRRRHVGPLARDAPRAAQRLVLGRSADRRRRHRRPRLPLHRDHPQLRRQGQPPGRGAVPHRHARPPDRRRGQRDRADPLRVRGDRAVRGQLDVPRRHGPARRGGRHARHDLDEPLPADRLRDVLGRRRAGRLRRREGRDVGGLAVPGRRRGRPSSATSTCSATCSTRWRPAARRRRRSTTATSSTRSWTPPTAPRRSTPGSRSRWTGAAARRRASPRRPRRSRARSSSSASCCPTAARS